MNEIEQVLKTFGGEVVSEEKKPAMAQQASAVSNTVNDNNKIINIKNQVFAFANPDEIIDLTQVESNNLPDIEMIWPGFYKGMVGALIGPSGAGKSYWILQTAVEVARKRKEKIIYVNVEDFKIMLMRRLHSIYEYLGIEKWQAVKENLIVVKKRRLNVMDDIALQSLIGYCKGALLIIFDTLSRIHKQNENDNTAMSDLVETFEDIAEKTGAGVLFTHHVAKNAILSENTTDQTAARGASALINNIRYAGYLTFLSNKELKDHGITDKTKYVKYGVSKQSYGLPEPERYYERSENGILIPTDLEKIKNKGGYYDKKDKRL